MYTVPQLYFSILGPPAITYDGAPLKLGRLQQRALLYRLAVQSQPVSRDHLAFLFWPDTDDTKARRNLTQLLSHVRRSLPDPGLLITTKEHVQLDLALAQSDAGKFEQLTSSTDNDFKRLEEACALYRSSLLSGLSLPGCPEFENWLVGEQARFERKMLAALRTLIEHRQGTGAFVEAIAHGERYLQLDPFEEEIHLRLVELFVCAGNKSAARRQYERYVAMLDEEFGVEPAEETTARVAESLEELTPGTTRLTAPSELQPKSSTVFLPVQPTEFLGRSRELAEIEALLLGEPASRLLTLVGPGGMGKTRLAIEAARRVTDAFNDGVTFISLVSVADATNIVPTIMSALHYSPHGAQSLQTQLFNYLREKRLLLIVDNFEHLLDGAMLISELLQKASQVSVLVTSRVPLDLQEEWTYPLDGLPYPENSEEAGLEPCAGSDAVGLFWARARRAFPQLEPTADDHAHVLHICRIVDGMPLALELAASWVRVLSLREIANEIEESFTFLSTKLRNVPERHRSMNAVFDHSWKHLSDAERHVFACCSVFRGGFTRQAASSVAGASLPVLASLLDKSLLRRNQGDRYEIHELARQYGADRLADSQEERQSRDRHLQFLTQLSEDAEPRMYKGMQVVQWHDIVEREHDNLRSALDWSLTGGDFESGMRIVGAAWQFWMNRQLNQEGWSQAEVFLARPEALAPTVSRAKVLHTAGVLAFRLGRTTASLARLTEGIRLARQLGDDGKHILAKLLTAIGYTHIQDNNYDAIQPLTEDSLRLAAELQDEFPRAHALNQRGIVAFEHADFNGAQRYFSDAFAAFQAVGQSVMRNSTLLRLGLVLVQQGDYETAEYYLRKSLSMSVELQDGSRIASARQGLAVLFLAQDKLDEAEVFLTKAVRVHRNEENSILLVESLDWLGRLARRKTEYARAFDLHCESATRSLELDSQVLTARSLEGFACLAAAQQQGSRAATLFSAAEACYAATGERATNPEMMLAPHQRAEHKDLLDQVCSALGKAAFCAAWAAGTAMTSAQAVAYALNSDTRAGYSAHPPFLPD